MDTKDDGCIPTHTLRSQYHKPIALRRVVARTHRYTYDAKVWGIAKWFCSNWPSACSFAAPALLVVQPHRTQLRQSRAVRQETVKPSDARRRSVR
jgi:hypothetical protein